MMPATEEHSLTCSAGSTKTTASAKLAITTPLETARPSTTFMSWLIKTKASGFGSTSTPQIYIGLWRQLVMELPINYNPPLIMHIDLNSCFAIIEQQANPLLRHKPVAIAAYDTARGAVIASSYEAKAKGIKLGVNVREARLLDRSVHILTPDPEKYFDAHRRFKQVLAHYTSEVHPKSIDEFVIDFRGSQAIQRGKSLVDVGHEIKADIKQALGEYVTVNIGIGTNRFLAKLAAGLHKPDGLDVITGDNLQETYSKLTLLDL